LNKVPSDFPQVLELFVRKLLPGDGVTFRYSWQEQFFRWDKAKGDTVWSQAGFYERNELLTEDDWKGHFFTGPTVTQKYKKGALGIHLLDKKTEKTKWICWDLDNTDIRQKAEDKLLPYYRKNGIPFIWEKSREENGEARAHLWVPVDNVPVHVAENWVLQVLRDIGSTVEEYDEIYPLFGKRTNIIRIPGGFHLKGGQRYPIVLAGEEYLGLELMQVFIDLPPVSEERLIELTREEYRVERTEKGEDTFLKGPLYYFPRRLESSYPLEELPRELVRPVRNCQALSELLRRTKEERLLNIPGATTHDWGLYLARYCMHSDHVLGRTDGEEFWYKVIRSTRYREWEHHDWYNEKEKERVGKNPKRYFTSCKGLEKFNLCDGCPYRGVIKSPIIFTDPEKAIPISPTVIEEVTLKTPEEIREGTLRDVESKISGLLRYGGEENILIATPPQSGKSYLARKIAAEHPLSSVLISVYSSDLAYEYQEELREHFGTNSFILGSFPKLFLGPDGKGTKKIAKIQCPNLYPILKKTELGIPNERIKEQYCASCPFELKCPWVHQYKNVLEKEHRIVICQHAHLGIPHVMGLLAHKKFDLVIIDESFTDKCVQITRPSYKELKILEKKSYRWCKVLYQYLKNGVISEPIEPMEDELERVKKVFDTAKIQWTVPQYIKYHNEGEPCSPVSGIEVVNRTPYSPVRVLLDATPPLQKTQMLTGLENITVIGDKDYLDRKRIHPGNRVVQVLDSSVSKTALERDELFYEILATIGYQMKYRWPDKKGLITAYKGWEEKVDEYFSSQPVYKGVRDRLDVSTMSRGTNKWEGHDVQWIIAGIHFTGMEYYASRYRTLVAWNHHRKALGYEGDDNPYPYDIWEPDLDRYDDDPKKKLISVSIIPQEIEALEWDEKTGKTYRVRYGQKDLKTDKLLFCNWVPEDVLFRLDYEENLGAWEQSDRMRCYEDKPKEIFYLGNMPLKGKVVHKRCFMYEFLSNPNL
jgi:hypothetical protein